MSQKLLVVDSRLSAAGSSRMARTSDAVVLLLVVVGRVDRMTWQFCDQLCEHVVVGV